MAVSCCHRTRTNQKGAWTRSPSGIGGQASLRGEAESAPSSKTGSSAVGGQQLSTRMAPASQVADYTARQEEPLAPQRG